MVFASQPFVSTDPVPQSRDEAGRLASQRLVVSVPNSPRSVQFERRRKSYVHLRRQVAAVLFAFAGCGAAWAVVPATTPTGMLDGYVRRPDAAYGWTIRRRGPSGSGEFAELILTSQKWRDLVWRHQLFVYKPARVREPSRAILLIGGGSWRDELLKPPAEGEALPRESVLLTSLADRLETTVAVLLQVPNQPIFDDLYEDAAISYSFEQFIRTGDDDWPLLLPMVKSAVRGMDAVAEFGAKHWGVKPDKFTLTGASKRGWTTWLTSAVDRRVAALAPMVIDMLNLPEHIRLQLASWGKFSEQVHDYTERGIHVALLTPAGKRLLDAVDPARYLDRIEQPKLVLLGTNDRYWPLESANLYWNDLRGEKLLLYVPNNGHGLRDLPRVVGGVAALHRHATGELTLPKVRWTYRPLDDGGVELSITSDREPAAVQAWTTTSPSRDFRDAVWTAKPIEKSDGRYVFRLPKPARGLTAVLGETQFADPVLPYYLSTTVHVCGEPSATSE